MRNALSPSDLKRSLEDLEQDFWEPGDFDSYVVRTSELLRKKPLSALTIEELRLAIGQPAFLKSLVYLMPLALEKLEADPAASGDFYEGDLLENVLRLPTKYWIEHPDEKQRLAHIVAGFLVWLRDEGEANYASNQSIIKLINAFNS